MRLFQPRLYAARTAAAGLPAGSAGDTSFDTAFSSASLDSFYVTFGELATYTQGVTSAQVTAIIDERETFEMTADQNVRRQTITVAVRITELAKPLVGDKLTRTSSSGSPVFKWTGKAKDKGVEWEMEFSRDITTHRGAISAAPHRG